MKNSIRCFFVFMVLVSVGCRYDETPLHVSSKSFTLTLPFFVKQDQLAQDATIQYANRFRNFYIVGFEKNKKSSLDSFNKVVILRICSSMDTVLIDSQRMTVHGLPCIKTSLNGVYPKEKNRIYYKNISIEGKNHFYNVSIWTRGIDRIIKYNTVMDSVLFSFNEK